MDEEEKTGRGEKGEGRGNWLRGDDGLIVESKRDK